MERVLGNMDGFLHAVSRSNIFLVVKIGCPHLVFQRLLLMSLEPLAVLHLDDVEPVFRSLVQNVRD